MKDTVYSHGDVPEDIPKGTFVLFPYCEDCKLPFRSKTDKYKCSMYWRPLSGTKHGFPIDGFNCPKDSWILWEGKEKEETK